MLPVTKIVQVMLVGVGFLLKPDAVIGFHPIMKLEKQNSPFNDVPEIERNIQEFFCLCSVNQLVVLFFFRHLNAGEDNAKEIDGIEVSHELPAAYSYYSIHGLSMCRARPESLSSCFRCPWK